MKRLKPVLAMAAVLLVLLAGSAFGAEFQAAPLNPEFEAFVAEVLQGTYNPVTIEGYAFGYFPPPVDVQALNAGQLEPLAAPLGLPLAWDWRSSPGYSAVTPVKNQGPCGSCWSFGNLGAVESNYKRLTAGHPDLNLSENNMIDIRDSGANKYCHWPWLWTRCGGGNTYLALSYLTGLVKRTTTAHIQKGALLETSDVYNSSAAYPNTKCAATTRPLPSRRINGARWVYGSTAAALQTAMKNAVYTKGPIVTAYAAESPGGPHWSSSNTVYHWPNCTASTNHEVLIIGWNDNKAWPVGGGKGAWLIKNSWGPFNSLGGYFWLTYGSAKVGSDAMYYTGTRPYSALENMYMEDPPGWMTNVGCGSNVAYGAVVLATLNAGEKLSRVEFYSPFTNMPYTIKIWDNVTGTTSVTFTTLLRTITGTCQEAGYYSIMVPTPPTLVRGKKYGVEVKFTGPAGYGFPIPCGVNITGLIAPYVGTGATNATTYARCAATGAFTRAVISGKTYTPNVRALTTR